MKNLSQHRCTASVLTDFRIFFSPFLSFYASTPEAKILIPHSFNSCLFLIFIVECNCLCIHIISSPQAAAENISIHNQTARITSEEEKLDESDAEILLIKDNHYLWLSQPLTSYKTEDVFPFPPDSKLPE